MFWAWLLKYSSLLVTGVVSFVVSYAIYWVTNRRSDLVYYTSHPQWVPMPPQQGQQQSPPPPIGTFTLFLWNAGTAPAKEVHVGHFFLPANNVFPDLPRQIVPTLSGGQAIKFPIIPPKTGINISYLFFGVFTVDQIISYVGWEEGGAKKIPVMLQRIWPKWVLVVARILLFAGMWVAVNATWSLVKFLWLVYYAR